MNGLRVIQPGILALIQDAGRFGQHHIGLSNGGPLDPEAFHWANRLCGNPPGVSAVEITIGGLLLESDLSTRLAVTGANTGLQINGIAKPLWQSHPIHPGDRIELGFATSGTRAYLAVAGGFEIPPSFGSSATVVREGIGGLNGGRLEENDTLPCRPSTGAGCLRLAPEFQPDYCSEACLRVVPGYQNELFSKIDQQRFFSSDYRVSEHCDRMGYRLTGPAVHAAVDGILSEGICLGAIQIPADGQPIVLLNDRQTIGGYPKIGSVISADLAKLAQLGPGADVSFTPVSIEEAHTIHCLARDRFQRIRPSPVDPEGEADA
jgi:biotin-dependent carboxylase-like uncharacterized protein